MEMESNSAEVTGVARFQGMESIDEHVVHNEIGSDWTAVAGVARFQGIDCLNQYLQSIPGKLVEKPYWIVSRSY